MLSSVKKSMCRLVFIFCAFSDFLGNLRITMTLQHLFFWEALNFWGVIVGGMGVESRQLGVWANTAWTTVRMPSENLTSHFCNHQSITQSHYACKTFPNYPGIKLEPVLQMKGDKIKDLLSYAHVVHTTPKQVISHHEKNESACEKCKNGKCMRKNIVLHCQTCQFVMFLLLSSLWFFKRSSDDLTSELLLTSFQCNTYQSIHNHTCLMSPKNSSPPVNSLPSDTFSVTSALS